MAWSRSSAAVYVASSWVVRAVRLQLLWLGLVLAGGVVLGVFPATFALLVASKRELKGGSWPLPAMWRDFRRFFWRSNIFGYVVSALTVAGFVDFGALRGKSDPLDSILRVGIVATTVLLVVWIPNAWVALANWETINLRAVRRSALCAVASPWRAVSVSGVAVAMVAGCFFVPACALIAGSALITLFVTRLAGEMYSVTPSAASPDDGRRAAR